MNEEQKSKPPRLSGGQIAQLIAGIILFGVLMGLRTEVQSVWLRMLVAAGAGTALAIAMLSVRRRRG